MKQTIHLNQTYSKIVRRALLQITLVYLPSRAAKARISQNLGNKLHNGIDNIITKMSEQNRQGRFDKTLYTIINTFY
jgi:hypothetical protein